MTKRLLTGNEAAVLGAIDAGAEIMFGYPITPSTEILEGWINAASKNKNLKFLQTEDETSAGFGVIGAISGGAKAFTATAGPGSILMQDPLSMAENLRLPFVTIMMQRGGPSTGTVNYSQQEVNLASFGGNGDGLRIVYSASNVEDMYRLTIQTFDAAWRYRFPAFLLGDGYLSKMKSTVSLPHPLRPVKSEKILKEQSVSTNLRNCYSSEESFARVLNEHIREWKKIRPKIEASEKYKADDAKYLIIAHGSVAEACKEAIDRMRDDKIKIGMFRAISIHPFDGKNLLKVLKGIKRSFVVESSLNQFSRIVKYETYGSAVPMVEVSRPAEGFTPDDVIKEISKLVKA